MAVERAITECIEEGVLKKFLEKNRAEAMAVSIYEYNLEEHIRMEREQANVLVEEANARANEANARADKAERRIVELEAQIKRMKENAE